MSQLVKKHETSNIIVSLTNKNAAKQAGSNNLRLTMKSDDWKVDGVTVSMSIRDAISLRNFLNENLKKD
jgi:hypothetical protein